MRWLRACCTVELAEDIILLVLKHACATGDMALFRLIAEKADVPRLNVGLLVASEHGHSDLAEALLRQGATNITEAVTVAYQNNHPQVASLLFQH